jgi:hypothetical protein
MPKFYVDVPVVSVSGCQVYSVDAETAEDAFRKIQADFGQFELVEEEIEVDGLDVESVVLSDFYQAEEDDDQ